MPYTIMDLEGGVARLRKVRQEGHIGLPVKCLWSDVKMMRDRGLGLGGTSENCVVFDEKGAMNTELRYEDEPVRHKVLDAVGDLALFGTPIWGHLEVERGGHLLHYRLLEALRDRPECWTWITSERGRWPEDGKERQRGNGRPPSLRGMPRPPTLRKMPRPPALRG